MSGTHPHHDHAHAAPKLSVLSSGLMLRLGVAGASAAALWLTIWWALA